MTELTPDWIVGFVDRAASFFVVIEPKDSYHAGRRLRPEFRIVQSTSEREILEAIQQYFGAGIIRKDKSDRLEFRIRDLEDLDKLMSFFDEHPLKSKKQDEVIRFRDLLSEIITKPKMTEATIRRLERMAKPLMKPANRGVRT